VLLGSTLVKAACKYVGEIDPKVGAIKSGTSVRAMKREKERREKKERKKEAEQR